MEELTACLIFASFVCGERGKIHRMICCIKSSGGYWQKKFCLPVKSRQYGRFIMNACGHCDGEELPSCLGDANSLNVSAVMNAEGGHSTYFKSQPPLYENKTCTVIILCSYQLGPTSSPYPGPCDWSCYSRTNDSASRHHLCSLEVSVFAPRQPLWLSVSVVSIFPPQSLSLSLPPIFSTSSRMLLFSFLASSVHFPGCHPPYVFFISSSSLLLHPMLWVNHASQSLVGRTVSTAHGNLSMMKTCNS